MNTENLKKPGEFREVINAAPKTFVVLTDWGTWGRGGSLKEAAEKAVKAGAPKRAKAVASVVLNDAEPSVSEDGFLWYANTAAAVSLGLVGTLGSLVKGGAS